LFKPNLRDYTPLSTDASPFVSVILPARNEAHNIERCVRSLLESRYPLFEVIVVNDRSTDDTGAIAERLAAADPLVRVLHGAERPGDWYGKPWACWQGFEASKGEVLLFTDADTVHGPELLPRAVAALVAEHVDLVTVMPRQEMITFWERVVQPFFFLMLGVRFGSVQRINRNRNPRHAIANGQFILVTRESYAAVGGHRTVKGTVIEDLMMAVTYLKAGKRHWFAVADQDMTTRMYTSLPGIIEGWSKNFFIGALETMRSKPLAYAGAIASLSVPGLFLLPLATVVLGILLHRTPWLLFGLAWYAAAALVIGIILKSAAAPTRYGLLHPLGAAVQVWIILRAIRRGTGRIEWKGRTYSHT
jgi:chlorobactene glucosyltransferase